MSTTSIRVTWSGGDRVFEPGTVITIGRDLDATVRPDNTNVSRRHAEIRFESGTWVLTDVGSAQGTWRNGLKVQRVEVLAGTAVTLGREGAGETLRLEPVGSGMADPAPTQVAGSAGVGPTEIVGSGSGTADPAGTVIVGQSAERPGGRLRAEQVEGATVVTGSDVHLECGGQSYSFGPGSDVVIGRDADCDVVSSNPTVSRRHARLRHDGHSWRLEDLGSSGGLFVDGERMQSVPVMGSTAVWLGDQTAGERVVLVASGTRPPTPGVKRRRTLMVVFGCLAVIALLALGLVVLLNQGPSDDQLARSSVRIIAGDSSGSGTVIDASRGLILTNAHVVAPRALGQSVYYSEIPDPDALDPKTLVVEIAPGIDKDAEPRFKAEVAAVDGYLDLAVIRITETLNGRLVEPGSSDLDDLVEIGLGDSDDATSGSEVRVFGYPSAAQTSTVTFTSGVVSGPVKDARLGSNRGMLNVSADIRPGNSGGLAVNGNGDMIGVPTLVRGGEVGSIRPVNFAKPLIEAAQAGKTYTSKLVRPLGDEVVTNVGRARPGANEGIEFSCSDGEFDPVGKVQGISFDYSGFEVGKHQDLIVYLLLADNVLGSWSLNDEYPVKWPSESGCATISFVRKDLAADVVAALPEDASFSVVLALGPDYEIVN